ncbi:hypothetical protein [Streptomyces sp. NBC_00102]|uniref:hypothetical protein n=1 Tax=Streptomyces sp. NBC_00102 TaxID=2975652 RepID=UPI00225B15C1|nr:hypothetical protein [Streptomyces sp. NBC_00102]MCX5401680.1 hypothetical protein [Streptomyces sp. NBC_00102]
MNPVGRTAWEAALERLLDDVCTFVQEIDRDSAENLRYGDQATYHTNVHKPGPLRGTLDFTTTSRSYSPPSVYSEDSGLVVVTDTEVGMFWNFADY